MNPIRSMTGILFMLSWAIPMSAQSITNKLGPGGVFTIKDATHDFFTVRQSDGSVGIGTTSPNNLFQVAHLISFDPFSGSTGLGIDALSSNVSAGNTATGIHALVANTGGTFNTATGAYALSHNIGGNYNTAVGMEALNDNTGSYNTGIGYNTLYYTTSSEYNVAVGYNAGGFWANGYNNVFVGAGADVTTSNMFNVVAVGQGTTVLANSTARFGNTSTVSYGGWANWSNVSDGRFKKNLRENVPGLDFVLKLRPVTYNLDATGMEAFLHKNDLHNKREERGTFSAAAAQIRNRALQEKEQVLQTGFVAQEVETAAQELGYDFSGVDRPKNANDYYGLRYAEFVVPLVKAVQELQAQIKAQAQQIETQEKQIGALTKLAAQVIPQPGAKGN
jgi:hypothetical protein